MMTIFMFTLHFQVSLLTAFGTLSIMAICVSICANTIYMFPFPEAEIKDWEVTENLDLEKLESVLGP